MNKRINFEDTIFILTVRIRMIKDLLRLNLDSGLFYRQTIGDLEFISSILDIMTEKFLANLKFLDRETEGDNLLDTEWQFSQLLNEISNNSSPYSQVYFPETQTWTDKLKKDSAKRRKLLEESSVSLEQSTSEPVVSNAELNGLLGSL
ncbi:MAG: hypothetical protein LBU88_08535 [Treponema sp.]|jgi:hypothetical protein|nr:hypothetical protein [Treponema sp.]